MILKDYLRKFITFPKVVRSSNFPFFFFFFLVDKARRYNLAKAG